MRKLQFIEFLSAWWSSIRYRHLPRVTTQRGEGRGDMVNLTPHIIIIRPGLVIPPAAPSTCSILILKF